MRRRPPTAEEVSWRQLAKTARPLAKARPLQRPIQTASVCKQTTPKCPVAVRPQLGPGRHATPSAEWRQQQAERQVLRLVDGPAARPAPQANRQAASVRLLTRPAVGAPWQLPFRQEYIRKLELAARLATPRPRRRLLRRPSFSLLCLPPNYTVFLLKIGVAVRSIAATRADLIIRARPTDFLPNRRDVGPRRPG